MRDIKDILSEIRLVPVVVLEKVEYTKPLCAALLEGGITVIEITLRTEKALDCIAEAAANFPEMTVGAGTLLTQSQVIAAMDSGAEFGVSPGMTEALFNAVHKLEFPFLPGGSSVSEFMANLEAGFTIQKFFPAETAGGINFLQSLLSPLQQISFCPTGGINLGNALSYLSLPNVVAVGGSWFVGPERIKKRKWAEITRDSREIIQILS